MESGTQPRGRGIRRSNGREGPSTYAGRNSRIIPFRGRGRPFRSRAGGRGRGFHGRRARPPYRHTSSHDRSPYDDRRDGHGSLERRHYERGKRSLSWSRRSRSRSRSRSRRRSRSASRSRSRSRSRCRSRGRSRTRSRSRSRNRSRYRSPVPVQTSGSVTPVKPVSVLERLGPQPQPQHLPTEKVTDPSVVQSIRITVGNDHYVQQLAAAEKAGGQVASGGTPGGASVDARGDNVEGRGSYPDRDRRWSSDQERDLAQYYQSHPGERYPHYRNRPHSGDRRSRERYPSHDYGTPRDQHSYSQERRTSADHRDYHSRSYYRRSPSRSPGRRDYRRSLSRSPDRRDCRRSPGRSPGHRDYRRSPGRSPGRRDYRRSPGRRSTSRSPSRDRYRRSSDSRSPSTSRSSYSTNGPIRDCSRNSGARDKEHHVESPIFRDTPEFRGTDGIPETPPVRSILKNKGDYSSIESPSPFRSESSLHGDVPVSAKTTQSHFGLPGIGCLDEIEDEDEFLYGGGEDSIKPATREPIVTGKTQCETYDYGHKPQRPDIKSFPSSLVPDYDEDAAVPDELPPPQQHNPNAGPSTLKPPSPNPKAAPKKEPYDPTIENILKAIGFNFELSKLMQEKAKKEREKQEKKDTLGAYSINQTSSFLGSGLKNIDLGSVFDQKAAEKEPPPVEKKEPEKTQLSYAELGRKYREEQMRAYQQGRSSPPLFHEKQRVERSRRKSDSLSPLRRERSRQRSESLSPPPFHRRRRSPSFERGSPRSTKRSRLDKDSDPGLRSPPRSMDRLPPTTQDKPTPATVSQPYSMPPPYYGAPGWDPNMPYGPYGGAYPGQYYPPGQYPIEWPPHFHPNYPPPPLHPDMSDDNQFYPKPTISSNLKVIPVIDDIAVENSSRKNSDSSAASPSQKPSSRTVLPPRSESERRVEIRRHDDVKTESRRRDDPKMSPRTEDRRRSEDSKASLRRDSGSSSSRPTLSQDSRISRPALLQEIGSSSRPTLSQEARERLMAEMQQRRKRLKGLEKELDTLRRQQNELMRKKQRQRDGHKDPLLVENSQLQDEIAQQISMLRRAADQNSSTLKAAGISDIEMDDSKQFYDEKSSQRKMEMSENAKTEKPTGKLKEEPNINYEYFDPGNHWCRVCNHISTNIFDVFAHLHSKRHQQNVDRYDRPWVPESLDLKNRLKKPTKAQIVVAPIKGVEFMMATQAFYCSICGTFSGDGACAEHHLKSKEHNDAYNEYCHDNPFYERHFDLDRAAGLSVMKFEVNPERESGGLEDALGIDRKSLPLSKDQMTVELVRRRVEAVERKIRLDKPAEDRKSRFHHDSHFGGDISSTPPPTHFPRPKDKFLAKEAAMAAKEQKERQGISIKLSGKQMKFPVKNPLSSSAASTKKLEPSLFRPAPKRPERAAPKPVPKPQKEAIFPLRKAEDEKQLDETDDYMSSVDMFVTSSDGTRKNKKPVPTMKSKSKALSQRDIAKAFSGREEVEARKQDTVLDSQVAAQQVVAPGSTQPAIKGNPKVPDVEPDSGAVSVSEMQAVSAVASTQAAQPAADNIVVPSLQDNEDAKSEGSGISMGSDFEILDELNAG